MANGLNNPAFKLIITPRGISRRRRNLSSIPRGVWSDLVKVLYLIRFKLQQEAFGTTLGYFWLVLEPALQAFTYFVLIRVIFGVSGGDMTFAFFFIGITFWRSHAVMTAGAPYFFATRGQQYIQNNMSLDIAYMELMVHEYILFLVRFVILCAFLIAAGSMPTWTWAFAPLISIVQFTFTMALVVWLSMFCTVVTDLGRFVAHVVWLWWYMSPGLYSISRIPEWARPFYDLNPFAHIIPGLHDSMLSGKPPESWDNLILIFAGSLALLVFGWLVLKRASYTLYRYI